MAKSGSKANAKRKHVEEFLESDDRFRILADDAPVLIWVAGPDGSEFVNLAYREFVGVSREADVLHFDWAQYVHPDDRERYLNTYLDCFRRQVPFNAVLRFRRHDGVYRWMKSIGKPRYTPSGEFYGYVGSTQDITDVMLLEDELLKARNNLEAEVEQRTRELQESEERYRELVENANSIIMRCDRNGRITFFNEYAQTFFGYSLDEIIGKDVMVLVPATESSGRDLASLVEGIKSTPERYANVVNENIRKNGERVWVSWTNRAIRDEYGNVAEITVIGNDITERKRSEEALRESKRTIQVLMDSIPEAMILLDRNGIVLAGNTILSQRQNVSRDKLIGSNIFDSVDPDVARLRRTKMDEVFSTGKQVIFEDVRNGRYIQNIVNPVFSEDGQVSKVAVLAIDITERKRSEEALRESEERFRTLADNIPNMAWMADADGQIIWFNKQWYDYTGTKLEDVQGWGWLKIHHPEYAEKVKGKWLSNIKAGRPHENVAYLRGKDGNYRWFLTRVTPIRDERGNICRWFGTNTDITERVQAVEALKESEQQLAEAQVLTHIGSWEMDLNTGEVVFSDNMLRIVGLSPGRYTYDEFQALVHPEDRERRDAAINDSIENGHPYDIEYRITLPDGIVRHIHAMGKISKDQFGKPIKFIVTIQDITERKRAEEKLNGAKAQAELYLDLMGHDINNMHQIALGYLEMAREMGPERRQSEFLDKPIEVLQRSAQLIQNVRKLQKLHDGVFQSQDIDVCGTLVDVQREFGAVPHKAITLNMNGCERCHVRANELLHDVFANLVSNAIKHTGDRADIEIDLDVVDDNGGRYCLVNVRDNGPGIPDDFKRVIFNRVLKGTNKAKGMGLGLYLVKSLVDSYGGRVWVDDRVPGDHTKGARFVVMLPAVENH